MDNKTSNVLVVVAHPDDEVLGCGGTIARHISRGDDIYIVVLCDGVTSRKFNPEVSRTNEIKMYGSLINRRKKEFLKATEILGISRGNCFLLNFPDQRLDTIPLLSIVKKIEELSTAIRPDIIYTHHWGDINKDHRICFETVITSLRPMKQLHKKVSLFCFSIHGNMNILPPVALNSFCPNHFVDIVPYLTLKLKSLESYKSELSRISYYLQLKNIMKRLKKNSRGKKNKVTEAFREIKINTLE